jgi:hypothetical protein
VSALIELHATLGAVAERLDMSRGPGLAALQKHYIEPTIKALDAVVVRAFGNDRRPFNDKPYPATVAYTVTAGAGATVAFRLSPKGFWVFGQYGTKPHLIPVSKAKRLKGGLEHPVRGPVKHPGSKGKRAIDQAWRAIRHDQHTQITAAVDEAFTDG